MRRCLLKVVYKVVIRYKNRHLLVTTLLCSIS